MKKMTIMTRDDKDNKDDKNNKVVNNDINKDKFISHICGSDNL